MKNENLPEILMYCPTSIENEQWNFFPSDSIYPAPKLLITASPISPEVKKNSKEVVFATLLDPPSERAHKPTDEQYPTKWNIWKYVSYQQSLKGILCIVMRKSISNNAEAHKCLAYCEAQTREDSHLDIL